MIKFTDIQRLYKADGGMLLDSKKIDRWRDHSTNREHQTFSGSDRAEKHTTVADGVHQAAVEKESENLFLNSETPAQQDITVSNDPYTLSFEGGGTIELTNAHTATVNGTEGQRTTATFTPSAGTLNVDPSGDVRKVQVEQSNYATLYIETEGSTVTRLAPQPSLTDFLYTDKATLGGWLDMVRTSGEETNFLFSSIAGGATHSRLFLRSDNNNFEGQIFGDTGGNITLNNPFLPDNWDNFTRKRFAWLLSYDATNITLYICSETGELYKATDTHAINDTSELEINIGCNVSGSRHTSLRYENIYIENKVATDDEVKQILAALSRYEGGPDLTVDQITIQ